MWAALVVLVLGAVPPVSWAARRTELMQALQFSLFALVVPALGTLGAPWSFGRAGRWQSGLEDLADRRRRHPEFLRAVVFLLIDVGAMIALRTPGAVDAFVRHPWLVAPEALVLTLAGVGLWLELVPSPPLRPRSPHPQRVALAALAMWTVWIMAYLIGLSHTSWYRAISHTSGHGLSAVADRQLSTAVLWFVAAVCFTPIVFSSLVAWLRSEDDPDEELFRLVREERRRNRGVPPVMGGREHPGPQGT